MRMRVGPPEPPTDHPSFVEPRFKELPDAELQWLLESATVEHPKYLTSIATELELWRIQRAIS